MITFPQDAQAPVEPFTHAQEDTAQGRVGAPAAREDTGGSCLTPAGAGDGRLWQARIYALVNDHRAARGLSPLRPDDRLAGAAATSSREQARRRRQGHYLPLRAAADRYGYPVAGIAENTGGCFDDPEKIFADWLGEPDHERALLSTEFTHMGAALTVADTPYSSLLMAGTL
ncbi:CAP domain-containing protein [Streptomyces syringium]|uniref:CAP domain-containing protein n=1 Tax=Streptomyces syringium TaxID=76729 RepID=UPI003AAF107E